MKTYKPLVGPPMDNLEIDPLAVLHLNNRIFMSYMFSINFYKENLNNTYCTKLLKLPLCLYSFYLDSKVFQALVVLSWGWKAEENFVKIGKKFSFNLKIKLVVNVQSFCWKEESFSVDRIKMTKWIWPNHDNNKP